MGKVYRLGIVFDALTINMEQGSINKMFIKFKTEVYSIYSILLTTIY